MIKLTKKQAEIVNKVIEIEKENNCTIYFKYDHFSKKIHPIKFDGIDLENGKWNCTVYAFICTHAVASTMENKGILTLEKVAEGLSLLKLNHELISA